MEINALFLLGLLLGIAALFYLIGRLTRDAYWNKEVTLQRQDALKRSRSVLKGQVSEQLAPYFPGFDFETSECQFIGRPIDFIVFKGMKNGTVEEVVFVEVKTGNSRLSTIQTSVKEAIENGRVYWKEFRLLEKE